MPTSSFLFLLTAAMSSTDPELAAAQKAAKNCRGTEACAKAAADLEAAERKAEAKAEAQRLMDERREQERLRQEQAKANQESEEQARREIAVAKAERQLRECQTHGQCEDAKRALEAAKKREPPPVSPSRPIETGDDSWDTPMTAAAADHDDRRTGNSWGLELELGYSLWKSYIVDFNTFAWGVTAHRSWHNTGLGLRFGIQGYHGAAETYDDYYQDTVRLTMHLMQIPLEFTFGNRQPKYVYIHGLAGAAIGFVKLWEDGPEVDTGATGPSLRPLYLGMGLQYAGDLPVIFGFTFRSDPLAYAIAQGAFLVDIRATMGGRF